ncbi:Gfo/Idh/MocA family oxidoreductase [Jeotgalibaca sp. MA1X17-3]|uniref:Gfo/Idh/MocA family protein n=1 Tax=Jeotgalibaca sp. MA1X17-3 TaxID=2908211 RepID=UPI001F43B204|nr:Gfo/Idh/MocA family oxidoreductase [Jeotgalibaca sp. MA1X17-3]UJF16177.1 Gfo/Idh/MocA family oxidoreductase [Jeotgalibaca sp. MA1X17-3]
MSKKVRLGIIGFGTQGSMYANFIENGMVPNMEIGAICDIDLAKREEAHVAYPSIPFYKNYIEMLKSENVDAIITAVPHYLHPEMGIEALKRDIHALVEKPAGVYTKQVKELNEFAASKPNLTFAIMFNQRNNPLYKRLKEIVESGEIGKIRRTNWIITTWWRPQPYYDQSEWRATWGGEGGGVLVNQAPHQLDLWQWICGIPETVYAKVSYGFKRDIVVEDEVTAIVDYGDGATGTFVTATHDLVGTDRFEILADQGKIVVENSQTAVVTRLKKPEQEISETIGMDGVKKLFMGQLDVNDLYEQETIEFDSVWGEQHAGVLVNFAANILDGTPLIAPGSDGINGVRLANAIHLSSWTKKEVNLKDLDEDLYLEKLNERIKEEGKFETRN